MTTGIEHRLNVFNDNAAMLELCREQYLASLNRTPLVMGMLTARWSAQARLEEGYPSVTDCQRSGLTPLCPHATMPAA